MTQPSPTLRAAWDRYLKAIENARQKIEETPRFRDYPENRAQAYDALFEAQAMVYNFCIGPRLEHPLVYTRTAWNTHLYTLGQNSPDSYYGALILDGRSTYRITGRFGDLKMIIMQVHNYMLGHPASKGIANYDFGSFDCNDDGSFEVIASAREHPGNWIQLDQASDCNFIFLRRWIYDLYGDCGDLRIEKIGDQQCFDEQSEEQLIARIDRASDLFRYLIEEWTIGLHDAYVRGCDGEVNRVASLAGKKILSDLAGSPSTIYGLGSFEIAPDEAVILEIPVPDCVYWSVQLGDVWSQSLDFMHHQTDLNGHQAAIDSDRICRMVIALSDPGIANWLDPVGRKQGTIVFRNYRSKSPDCVPAAKLVKLSDLTKLLPSDTRRVTAEERVAALRYRREGFIRRYIA